MAHLLPQEKLYEEARKFAEDARGFGIGASLNMAIEELRKAWADMLNEEEAGVRASK